MSSVVTFTYAGATDEESLDRLASELPEDATVAALPGRGYTVTLWADTSSLADAVFSIETFVKGLGDPVAVESVSEAEYERMAYAPTLPQVLSAVEVADVLGVTRQRVNQLSKSSPDFPTPLFTPRSGPLWERFAIEAFARSRNRNAGRPQIAS